MMHAKPTYKELERRVQELKTDYSQLEKKLHEARSFSEEIITHMTEGLVQTDTLGTVIFINQRLSEMLGYLPEEIIGKCWLDMVPIEQQAIAKEAEARRAKGHTDRYEIILHHKNGHKFPVLIVMGPRFDKQSGEFIGTMGVVTNIAKRKLAEETLQESNEGLTTVLDAMDVHVYIADMETYEVLFSNLYGRKTWGDNRGQKCWSVFQKDQDGPCAFCTNEKLLDKDGKPTGVHVWEFQNTANGRWFNCRDVAIPWTDGRMVRMEIATDITERKRAEDELKSNYSLLQIAGETANFGGWCVDLENNICTWSDAVADIHEVPHGYTPPVQEAINFYAPEWREKITQILSACAKEGIAYDEEMEIITQKGKRVWVRATGKAVKNEKDKIIKVQGSFQDITERKQAEENLLKSEQRFSLAMAIKNEGIWDWNLVTNETLFDERYYIMAGYTNNEFPQNFKAWAERVHPEDLPNAEAAIQAYLSGQSNRFDIEFRFRHKEGYWMWIQGRGKIVKRDESGVPLRMIGTHTNITERKRAEMDLQAQKKLLEGILDSIKDIIGVQLPDHTIVQYNRAGYELLGLTKDQVKGKKCYELFGRPNPCDYCVISKAFISKRMETVEKYIPELGRHFLCTSNPVLDDNGNIKLIIEQLTDITEKKKIDEQLHQAQKMESIGRLAGGVAHDFNNMLGVILGHVEFALEEAEKNQNLYSNLKEIQKAAKRSADTTKQLLAFARKEIISPKQIDLNDTVESMLNMLRRLIGEDIDLVWQPAARLWPVKMDPSQIDQILANLCVNARDAISGVGKLTIETGKQTFDEQYCSEHPGFIPGDFVLLAVSDNGCGMDKDTLNNLFEPFFTTKEVGKGTGLGLATIYGIVKQNKGFINVYSEPGQGSTFKIYLPRMVADEDADKAVSEKKTAAGGTETILLVEDEPSILRMIRMMLKRKGYKVLSAATPTEAFEKAKNHSGSIDLLMTDVIMPEMHGRSLAEKITDIYPDIRLLFMSGYTADVIAHHGVLDEGVAFIQKPFSNANLAEKLREVLDTASDKT